MSQYVSTAMYFKHDVMFDVRVYSDKDDAVRDAKDYADEHGESLEYSCVESVCEDTATYLSDTYRVEIKKCLVE